MKNIFIVPTKTPSGLWVTKSGQLARCNNHKVINPALGKNVEIYIIDSAKIPYNPNGGTSGNFLCLDEVDLDIDDCLVKNVGNCEGCRRIAMTTNPEMIKEKIQEIPEDFIKWLIKNQECEMVELDTMCLVEERCKCNSVDSICQRKYYGINIPDTENIEKESFENRSLKWWMGLSSDEQVEIGLKYHEPTFNLTLRAIMFEHEQFLKK